MSTADPSQPISHDPSTQVEKSPIETSSTATSSAKTTGTRHRRSASDIKPTSPAARRMSMSSTPQSMKGNLPSEYGIQRVLRGLRDRPLLGMAAVLSLIVLSATAYSSAHSLALDTSLYPSPSRTAYFAQKTNPFNQYGVKLAWLHTSLIYLSHLFSSPSSLLPRLWAYSLSTLFWGIFTTWFFGRGIGDRIIELSGGKCVIALPKEWGLDRQTVGEMMKIVPSSVGAALLDSTLDATSASLADTANIPATDDNLYLSVPASLCTTHRPLTPKSYPDIFSIISNLPFPASTFTDSSKPTLSIPKPRWYRGHDISGHIFILVLSTLLLTRELFPTWRRWLGSTQSSRQGGPVDSLRSNIHIISTLLGTALVALWLWMTLMTSIYFHNPQEKLSGLALGLVASFVVDLLTPRSTSPLPHSKTTSPVFPRSKASVLDENRARRGSVVDDGRVIELESAVEIDEVEGKEKVE